jgi:lysophospholipase L1-like esterase
MSESGSAFFPFWSGSTVYGEPLLFVKKGTGSTEGRLFFRPAKILKVESAARDTVYREGKDYLLSGDTLSLPAGSGIPFVDEAELHPAPTAQMPSYIRLRGHPDIGLLFGEGSCFHKLQTCVTYSHPDAWGGPAPAPNAVFLPKTLALLKAKRKMVIGVSGDSISAGANASKCTGVSPFQPPFPDLVAEGLGALFGAEIVLKNRAVGGWMSSAGLEDSVNLAAENADLVIIAYGMNDDLRVETPQFIANIRGIVEAVRKVKPESEFILVAGMCGNSEWAPIKPERFPAFRDALLGLAGEGIAVADVTSIWLELMKRKRFLDLTGNGVNHPNDFGHRLYAQVILSCFAP